MSLIHPLIHDWNAGEAPGAPSVMLDDETLRDGLQSPSVRTPAIEEKLWRKHHVLPEEVWDVLLDDDDVEIFSGRQGKADYVAIGRTRGGRKLLVAFYKRRGVADIATAFEID